MLNLRRDEHGATPLTVIAVVVLVAAGVAAILVMALVGGTRPDVAIQQVGGAGVVPAFQVTQVHGDLTWDGLSVQFLDPAGVDHAAFFLSAPNGTVQPGQQIQLRSMPPGGTYLLLVLQDERELVRLAATF